MSVITRTAPKSPPTSIEIVAWPLRDRPSRACMLIAILSLVAIAVIWVTGSRLLALLAAALTALSAWRILIPQRFEFSPSGITQQVWRRKRHIPWSAIGRWEPRADGIYLLPATADAPIDSLHSLYIPLGERRDEVLALVERHMTRAVHVDASSIRSSPPAASNSARLDVKPEERPA